MSLQQGYKEEYSNKLQVYGVGGWVGNWTGEEEGRGRGGDKSQGILPSRSLGQLIYVEPVRLYNSHSPS